MLQCYKKMTTNIWSLFKLFITMLRMKYDKTFIKTFQENLKRITHTHTYQTNTLTAPPNPEPFTRS